MGGPFVSGPADVRLVLLRRHLLDHQSGVRGSVDGGPRLVYDRLRFLPQRLFTAVHLRRTDSLRYAAGPLGSEADRLDIRRAYGRGRSFDNIRHIREFRGQPSLRVAFRGIRQAVAVAGIRGVRDVRPGQRDSRCDCQPGDSQMVQRPRDSLRDGPAAGPGPSWHGGGSHCSAAYRGFGRLHTFLRDIPSGRGRSGPAARRPYSVGLVRGDGLRL